MIIGLGIDLVDIEKISASVVSETYLHKVFTDAEIDECRSVTNAIERFAGKFAAKEACMKALGKGIRQGIWFTQIEILNEASGKPYVRLSGEMERSINSLGDISIHVSITHTRQSAAAVVILEAPDNQTRNAIIDSQIHTHLETSQFSRLAQNDSPSSSSTSLHP